MVKVMEAKLHTLREGSPGAQEKAINVVCKKMGARFIFPSRCTQLAEGEEEVRAELTWQQFDERMFIASCGEVEELKTWVADPQRFVQDRAKTWLLFSDQVPIWIKIGMLKILYSAAELAETGKRAQAAVKAARRQFNMTHGQDSQQLVPADPEEAELHEEEVVEEASGKGQKRDLPSDIESASEEDAAKGPKRKGPAKRRKAQPKKNLGKKEGMSQCRGGDASGEKCRVTMEFRQGVSGYFANGKEEVKGHILPSVLVLKSKVLTAF